MESLRDVVEVASVKPSDRDATISSHVDGVLGAKLVNHIFSETSEGKHSDLVNQVLPGVLTAEVLKFAYKTVAHLHDTSRHKLEVIVPHLGQLFISQDDVNNTCTVNWWVRVESTG